MREKASSGSGDAIPCLCRFAVKVGSFLDRIYKINRIKVWEHELSNLWERAVR